MEAPAMDTSTMDFSPQEGLVDVGGIAESPEPFTSASSGPSRPPPDFSTVFWNAHENRPKMLYDLNPTITFTHPIEHATALHDQCTNRLAIYKQLEKAIKDENSATHPSWWRRILRSSVWKSWWCCCGTCCLGHVCCGDEWCLRWSDRREAWKALATKIWDLVHGKFFKMIVMDWIVNIRSIWVILKMFTQVMGFWRFSTWL